MAVLAQAEQHQIEFIHVHEIAGIVFRCGLRAELGGNGVHLLLRDGDVVEPCLLRHMAIALGMFRRQAAFVAEINVPCTPCGIPPIGICLA